MIVMCPHSTFMRKKATYKKKNKLTKTYSQEIHTQHIYNQEKLKRRATQNLYINIYYTLLKETKKTIKYPSTNV